MKIGVIGTGNIGGPLGRKLSAAGRPVIKAFNNILPYSLAELGRPEGSPGRLAVAIAGDDTRSQQIVMDIVNETGLTLLMLDLWTSHGGSNQERLPIVAIMMLRQRGRGLQPRPSTRSMDGHPVFNGWPSVHD